MAAYKYIKKRITWDGKRYEVRGKTEAEALEKLAELLDALKDGRPVTSGDTYVNDWFQEWKRVYKIPSDLTRKSLKLYDEKYHKYIGPVVGKMRLRDVRDIQLQSILNEQRGMSFSHVTKLRMVMQELFHQAYRSRLIPFDPSDGLRLPKNVKGSHRSITEEERAHILEVAQYHPSGLWVLLILYSGLRPGEAAALQWKDIDFDKNEIHVYKAVESGTNTIVARTWRTIFVALSYTKRHHPRAERYLEIMELFRQRIRPTHGSARRRWTNLTTRYCTRFNNLLSPAYLLY